MKRKLAADAIGRFLAWAAWIALDRVRSAVACRHHLTAELEVGVLGLLKRLFEILALQLGVALGLVLQPLFQVLVVQLQLDFDLGGTERYLHVLTDLGFELLQLGFVVVALELG